MKKNKKKKTIISAGFSFIELLIAMTISFIIIGGILSIFFNSKKYYLLNNGYAQLQETNHFLSLYLGNLIRLSGYRSPPTQNQFADSKSIFSSASPYISVSNMAGANGSDILSIRYQGSGNGTGTPDGNMKDCLNNSIDANVIATNILSINNSNQLQCQAINASSSTPNSTDIIADGVENMHILFGEDLNGDMYADRYVPPNYPGINLNNIVSVRIALLIRSLDDVDTTVNTQSYSLVGTIFRPAADKKIRSIMTFTVQLKNRPNMS